MQRPEFGTLLLLLLFLLQNVNRAGNANANAKALLPKMLDEVKHLWLSSAHSKRLHRCLNGKVVEVYGIGWWRLLFQVGGKKKKKHSSVTELRVDHSCDLRVRNAGGEISG